MISYEDAVARIVAVARPLGTEELRLDAVAGRILARDILAAIDSPRRAVSAMDGYAVRDQDLATLPARLFVTGESFAGQEKLPTVRKGECARIFTGGAVPEGADRVVVQEIVRRDGDWAIFEEPFGPARHIRAQASDFSLDDRLVCAGSILGARTLVAAAAADMATVEVFRAPRFTVLSTGDELAEPGTAREHPALIPESLSVGLAVLGSQWGGQCVTRSSVADEQTLLRHAGREALARSDLLVVTGGASVGEKDFAKSMFSPDAMELLFDKVAMKPGKPVWLGRASGHLVLGLPGNPTSAMVTARLLLAPLMAGLSGRDPHVALRWRTAPLGGPLDTIGDRETFLRACWSGETVEPLTNQESGAQKALVDADLLIRRPAGAPAMNLGDLVEVLDF